MAVCALRNRFLGRPLGPSAKYPAYRARIFRRGAYRHDEARKVHEGIEPHKRPLVLDGDLEHELAATAAEALRDAWRYAQLEASHIARPTRAGAYLNGIALRPTAKLLYRTFLDGGWRDGWRGLAKIALDVASDMIVWVLVLTRSQPGTVVHPASELEHFGPRRVGPVKVVAIASGEGAAREADAWLGQLRAQGIDVALVAKRPRAERGRTGGGLADAGVPVQAIEHLRPLALMRALDVERQLRTTDAVVAVGRRARLLQGLLPNTLRPEIPGLRYGIAPARAAELARLRAGER